jgi:hypothetical protein
MELEIHIFEFLSQGSLLALTLCCFFWCDDKGYFPLAVFFIVLWGLFKTYFLVQLCFALLPILFLAYCIKELFFPTFRFQSLFQRQFQSQNSSNSSYASSSNDLEQVGAEEIPSNNSMPIFLRNRAQRLGLTPTASPSPNASNSQPTQSLESSQPVPAEPIDPTLLPPSEDVPGQTVYRRIIPIQP